MLRSRGVAVGGGMCGPTPAIGCGPTGPSWLPRLPGFLRSFNCLGTPGVALKGEISIIGASVAPPSVPRSMDPFLRE